MKYLNFKWVIKCDDGKATIASTFVAFNISWRPDELSVLIGGHSHTVVTNHSAEIECIECAYTECDETAIGTPVTQTAKLQWVLHSFLGPSGLGPFDWPGLNVTSWDTIQWEGAGFKGYI